VKITLTKGKYTVYGGDGKVIIISTDKSICVAYANQLKGVLKHG